MDMVNEALGSYGNNLIIAVVGVGVALIGLAIVLWLIKRRGGSSPFIRGGRNRQPRLQVLDAAAVDARRRLVLVRRDNVEHLVMIGGPTDIVIESGIGAIPVLTPVDQRDNLLSSSPYDDERQEQVEKRETPRTISQTREVTHEQPVKAAPIVTPAPVSAPVVPPAPTPAPAPVITPPPVVSSAPASAPAPVITPPPVVPPIITPAAPAVAPTVATPSVTREPSVARPAPSVEPASEAPRPFRQEPPVVAPASAPPVSAVQSPITQPATQAAPSPAAPPVAGPIAPSVIDRPPVVVAAAPVAAAVATPPDVVPPIKPAAVTTAVEPPPILQTSPYTLDEINAGDILESARNRVLPNRETVEPPIKPVAPAPEPTLSNEALSSDFEKFLEAEIAKSAPAAEQGFAQVASTQQQPRRDPSAPPISGASTENEIQKEMARIFGEMSVTRDR
jgi:hypothetical protein